VILLGCNFIVLTCWTVMDPLTYTRLELEGTDYWNRVIATTGRCRSDQVEPYIILLVTINFVALCLACWQAFRARDIDSNFSETRFIGFSLASILQTFLSGIPIIAVVRDLPDALYLITTFMIFVLTLVILMFIFVPKMIKQHQFSGMTKKEQMIAIKASIQSSIPSSSGSAFASTSFNKTGGPSGLHAMTGDSKYPQQSHKEHGDTNDINNDSQPKSRNLFCFWKRQAANPENNRDVTVSNGN